MWAYLPDGIDEMAIHGLLRELRRGGEGDDEAFVRRVMSAVGKTGASDRADTGQGIVRPAVWRRWLVPLAAAASLAIVVGVYWLKPAAGLGLRVAEVRGKCSVFSGQWSVVIRHSSVGGGGQAAGVTESPSHQVAKAGEGMNAQRSTPNAQRPSGEAGSILDTRHSTLKVGDVLRPGDGVEVGADGYVKLAYPDTTQVELQQNTRLRVTLGAGTEKTAKRLALDGGKFVCSAAPQNLPFEIKTRHATARVVGTRFSLDVTDPRTLLTVAEGKVQLIQGDKILEVEAGQSAAATEAGMEMVRAVVYAWGGNRFGQLGNGTTNGCLTPVPGPDIEGVLAIAAGAGHTVALKFDQTVWAWGYNGYGQLGDGSTVGRSSPAPVRLPDGAPLSGITGIAAGGTHTVALKSDCTVWTWGDNNVGQLGDGTTNNHAMPVRVSMADGTPLSGITAVAAGECHNIAMKADGTLWAWGHNESGQLGDGTKDANRLAPVQVRMNDGAPFTNVIAIAAGYMHTLALRNDNTVWAWGDNRHSQLGFFSNRSDPTVAPVQVPGLSSVTAIAAGRYYAMALKADRTVWIWGQEGILVHERHDPKPVTMSDGNPLGEIIAIAAGDYHALALANDRTVWTWGGGNDDGQLGDGTTTQRLTPLQGKLADGMLLRGITSMAAGAGHTVVVVGDREESVGVSE